jgi:hypothetical protein
VPNPEQLASFVDWFIAALPALKKEQAQIFLDRAT